MDRTVINIPAKLVQRRTVAV